jgi:hypothetical protein
MAAEGLDDDERPEFDWIDQYVAFGKLRRDIERGRSLRVLVYSWGLIRIDGDDEDRVAWEEIDGLYQKITKVIRNGQHTVSYYTYTLRLGDGRSVQLASTMDADYERRSRVAPLREAVAGQTTHLSFEQLGRQIKAEVARVRLPEIAACLQAGEAVSFGPLRVTPAGLFKGRHVLRWDEIEDVRVSDGIVSFKKKGQWLAWKKVAVEKIPNYFLFDPIVRAILAQRITRKAT